MGRIRPCCDGDRTQLLGIINSAAEAYRGVIPADCWHEPYMTTTELDREISAGVAFWGHEAHGELLAVMGIQTVRDVNLIRHAYVLPKAQRHGLGARLLEHLRQRSDKRILVGTWAAATWAIDFYRRNGFELLDPAQTATLLETYWRIPDRQADNSVVLAAGHR